MPRSTRQEAIRRLEAAVNEYEKIKSNLFTLGTTYTNADSSIAGICLVSMDMIDELIRLTNKGIAELKGV